MSHDKNLEALLAGAVEAATIVSERTIRDEADRVQDGIDDVAGKTKELQIAIGQMREVVEAISRGYDALSGAIQKDVLAALEDIKSVAEKSTAEAVTQSSAETGARLGTYINKQMEEVSRRLIEYVDDRHGIAIAAQKNAQIGQFDGLKQDLLAKLRGSLVEHEEVLADRLESTQAELQDRASMVEKTLTERANDKLADLSALMETAEQAQKTALEIVHEKLESAIRHCEEVAEKVSSDVIDSTSEVYEEAKETLSAVVTEAGDLLTQAAETLKKTAAESKTEVFLYTENVVKNLQADVQEILGTIEPIPGPKGPPGPQGEPGQDGILTRVEQWHDKREYRRRDCVAHLGGIWQCRSDTEEEPGYSVNWASLVTGIQGLQLVNGHLFIQHSDQERVDLGSIEGPPGRTPRPRGTWDKEESYEHLDIVILRGTSYVARCDNPGTCPGKDWMMLAQAKSGPAGKPGKRGPEGKSGPPGPVGPPGRSWRWRGRYVPGEIYSRDDIVNFSNALWIALRENQAQPKADQEDWDLVLRVIAGGGGGGTGGGIGTDEKVGVTAGDAAPGYLQGKLQSGDGSVIFTLLNAGGDERLDLQATGAGGGESNTGQNVGTGVDVFRNKTGVALNFHRIGDTPTVVASLAADTVSLNVPANTFDAFGAAATVQSDLDGHKTSGDHDSRYDAAGTAAAGDAAHTSAFDHANIPEPAQKAALDANFLLTAGNPVAGQNDDEVKQTKVSATDTTPNFLLDKMVSGDGSITLTKNNPGGDEIIDMRAPAGVSTFIALTDTPADYALGNPGDLLKINPTGDGVTFGGPAGVSVAWGDITGGDPYAQLDLGVELNAKLGDAPTDGNTYSRRDGGWVINPITPIGGVWTQYTWDANTAATSPAVGGVKANNAAHPSATAIYIHATTGGGNDASAIWAALQAGDYFGIWEEQSDREGIYYTVTGPAVNNGGWFTIPVAVVPGSLGGMDDGQAVSVFSILDPLNKLALGGSAGQAYVKQSGANYDGAWVTLTAADVGAKEDFAENSAFNKDFGTGADTVCEGNDGRLSDARTPIAHAASHMGGADAITPAGIGAIPESRAINTTGGIQGGGDGTQDRTHSLTDTGVTPAAYTNADITVDAKGRITAAASGTGGSNLHADLTDTATDGHPGTVITIPAGVQGNAVSIAADGTLEDSGVPPGGSGSGIGKGTPFVTSDLLAVQSDAGAGVANSVGFAAADVARLSLSNTFTGEKQAVANANRAGFCLFQTGTPTQEGRWELETFDGYLFLRSVDDSGTQVQPSPELRSGHGNNTDQGFVLGVAAFQGFATLNAENGLFDGGNRVYSAGNPPPTGAVSSVTGADSINVSPTTGDTVVSLEGDAATPGNSKYWGTSGAGVKGFHDLPAGGGWQDGTTIADWGDTGQTITGSGAQTLDLDNGHFASGTLTASKTITFQSTAAHANTSWDVILATGGNTPTWAFTGATVNLPDGYDVSANATYWFTFRKVGAQVYVSERKMQ